MGTQITRHIVLDTETTGMNRTGIHYEGHRIIEIGAVEIINRRLTGNNYHVYLKPDRLIAPGAFNVHGIADEFLLDKPEFSDIADDFINYIRGAELVIHNAVFDIGFIDYEFGKLKRNLPKTSTFCTIFDSLALARKLFPGKRNNLDALCHRYNIDNSKRKLHGALLDAQILAEVYLTMTGGQTSMAFARTEKSAAEKKHAAQETNKIDRSNSTPLRIIQASAEEIAAHQQLLSILKNPLWK